MIQKYNSLVYLICPKQIILTDHSSEVWRSKFKGLLPAPAGRRRRCLMFVADAIHGLTSVGGGGSVVGRRWSSVVWWGSARRCWFDSPSTNTIRMQQHNPLTRRFIPRRARHWQGMDFGINFGISRKSWHQFWKNIYLPPKPILRFSEIHPRRPQHREHPSLVPRAVLSYVSGKIQERILPPRRSPW